MRAKKAAPGNEVRTVSCAAALPAELRRPEAHGHDSNAATNGLIEKYLFSTPPAQMLCPDARSSRERAKRERRAVRARGLMDRGDASVPCGQFSGRVSIPALPFDRRSNSLLRHWSFGLLALCLLQPAQGCAFLPGKGLPRYERGIEPHSRKGELHPKK